jgi:hypothetical protein
MPPRNDVAAQVPYGLKEGNGYCVAYPFRYQPDPQTGKWRTVNDFVCFSHNDAHLIAAAPELYEALNALMGGDEKMQVGIGGNPLYVERFIDRARAALAKARGEPQQPRDQSVLRGHAETEK